MIDHQNTISLAVFFLSKLTTSVHSRHLSPGAGADIPGPSAHGSCTQNNPSASAAPAHQITPLTQSFIRLGFLNVCSLRNKVAEVADILQQYNFDIFGVAETWLDSSTSDSDIDIHVSGFCVIQHDRPVRRGGGVCFYFRSGLQVKPRPELSDANIESSCIEFKGRRRRQLVGCFYRPPDEPILYWQNFEEQLHRAFVDNPSITVIGDFNVNVSTPYQPCPIARKFLELCNCYGLTNHVHAPTRISPACPSGTTIDRILLASQDISECHVLPLTISDHFGIGANQHLQVSRSVSPQAVERVRAQRNTRSVNICEFRRDVSSAGLDDFTNTRDVDTMWASWHTKFLAVVDKHAPIRYVSSNRKSPLHHI